MIDLNTPVGQLRLEVMDMGDIPILDDASYTYILAQHDNVVKDSVVDALRAVQGKLAFSTRERLDRLEFYGNQTYEQYSKWVADKIKYLSGIGFVAGGVSVYAGGVFVSDVTANLSNPDVVRVTSIMDNTYCDEYSLPNRVV